MTQVDFYTGAEHKLRTCCLLTAKAVQKQVRSVIYLPDTTVCQTLDKLLWEYPPTGFIPHFRAGTPQADDAPVILCTAGQHLPQYELLINLDAQQCPPDFERFSRVIEIVTRDQQDSRLGRQRFKQYRSRGFEPGHIDLSKHK